MSSFEDQENKHQARRRTRKSKTEIPAQSSRLGYGIILLCVVIMVIGVFITQQFDKKVAPQPKAYPSDVVNVDALSATWTCPVSGEGTDSLLISNPDSERAAQVNVRAYDSAGTLKGSVDVTLEASQTEKVLVSDVAADSTTSIVVQSFSSSIVVVRNIELSDGNELVSCINDPVSEADFSNLVTVRNANALVVIANPYDVPVVVDLLANLTDNSVNPPSTIVDEERGVIVPAHGRVAIDLQSEFGRYSIVSVNLKSRSGFFVSEVFQSFTGGESTNGQTIISRIHETKNNKNVLWTGIAPTRIVARNDSNHTHSVQLDVLASDNRSISGEAQTVTAGSTTILENLGADFSARLVQVSIVKSSHRPSAIFTSWIHAAGNAVSAGSSTLEPAMRAFVPVAVLDTLYVYNPGSSKASVTVSIAGTAKTIKVELDPLQFKGVSLEGLGVDVSTFVDVSSTKPIVSGAGDKAFTRYSQGIDIR